MSIAIEGYRYGVSDQIIYLQAIWYWVDPSNFHSNDIFYSIAPKYYSVSFPFIASLVRFLEIPITWIFFIGYILAKIMLYIMIYHLAKSLGISGSGAYFAVALLLINHPIGTMAGNIYKNNYFAPQIVALPIILLAISLFIRGRTVLPFFILGLAINIHSFTSVHGIIVIFVALLWQRKHKLFEDSTYILGFKAACAIILGSLPVTLWMFTQGGFDSGGFYSSQEWLEYVRLHNSYIFPSLWPFWGSSGQGAPIILISLIGVFILITKVFADKTNLLLSIFLGFTILILIGMVGTEVFESPMIINMQVRRAMTLPWIITGIMIAGYIFTRWEIDRNLLIRASLLLFGVTFGLSEGPKFLLLGFVLVILFEFLLFKKIFLIKLKGITEYEFSSWIANRLNIISIFAMAFFLIIYLVSNPSLTNIPWWISWWIPKRETFLLFLGLATVIGLALATVSYVGGFRYRNQIPNQNIGYQHINRLFPSIQNLILVTIIISGILWYKAPQIDLSETIYNARNPTEWRRAADWANQNTNPGSLFLVPPKLSGFGALSGRNIFVDHKNASLGIFSPKSAKLWTDRWNLLENYYSISAADINKIGEQHQISHIVMEKEIVQIKPNHVYENDEFVIYELPLSLTNLDQKCLQNNINIINSQSITTGILELLGEDSVILPLSNLNNKKPFTEFSTLGQNKYLFNWNDQIISGSCLTAASNDDDFWSNGDGMRDFPFSIGAWINPTEVVNVNNVILSKFDSISGKEWEFRINPGAYLDFALYDHSVESKINIRTEAIVPTNKWSFVIATYNGSGSHDGIKIYINGQRSKFGGGGSSTDYIAMENTHSKPVFGSYSDKSDGFKGMVGGGASGPFYTKNELDEAQILKLYDKMKSSFNP